MLGQENKQTFCIFEIEVKQAGAELGQDDQVPPLELLYCHRV